MQDDDAILKSCLSILPVSSSRDVAPGEVMTVEVRSSYSEFPEKAYFGQETSSCFEVDEVSLRPWRQVSRVTAAIGPTLRQSTNFFGRPIHAGETFTSPWPMA